MCRVQMMINSNDDENERERMKTMKVWEVKVIDQADFCEELFCELFDDETIARRVGEQELQNYRDEQDDEFKNSIVLNITTRTINVAKKSNAITNDMMHVLNAFDRMIVIGDKFDHNLEMCDVYAGFCESAEIDIEETFDNDALFYRVHDACNRLSKIDAIVFVNDDDEEIRMTKFGDAIRVGDATRLIVYYRDVCVARFDCLCENDAIEIMQNYNKPYDFFVTAKVR